jgi:hypothetical protein
MPCTDDSGIEKEATSGAEERIRTADLEVNSIGPYTFQGYRLPL